MFGVRGSFVNGLLEGSYFGQDLVNGALLWAVSVGKDTVVGGLMEGAPL